LTACVHLKSFWLLADRIKGFQQQVCSSVAVHAYDFGVWRAMTIKNDCSKSKQKFHPSEGYQGMLASDFIANQSDALKFLRFSWPIQISGVHIHADVSG
jgi:hypothetical protein